MKNKVDPNDLPLERNDVDNDRRNFLLLIPIAIFASVAGAVATAAFRFLRPISASQRQLKWIDAMPMAHVKGDKPLMCSIVTERTAGWATTLEEQQVFVLPSHQHQAFSSTCPHEGCNVMWREEKNDFFCPCHDSLFGLDGARMSGPAPRGLDPLPTREKDGMLQVQYQTFVNNKVERIPRA